MSQRSPILSRMTRGPGVRSSRASFCLPVNQVLRASIRAENIFSKASQLLHYSALEFGDFQPGYRGNRSSPPLKNEQASTLSIKWTCPPKFILNDNWHVAAGEQSEESRIQEQREISMTEVIYPHPSAIPISPSISLDVEEGHLDDGHNTPFIPLDPIEDDLIDSICEVEPPSSIKESSNLEVLHLHQGVTESHLMANSSQLDASTAAPRPSTGLKQQLGLFTRLEADIGAAASAAFTALMKSYEQGSLIDTDLLIKILSDPKMIELLKDAGSFGIEKTPIQPEAEVAVPSPPLSNPKLETRPSSSSSRNPVKEGSNRIPARKQITSEMLAQLVSDTAIPSAPLRCPVPDTLSLWKQVRENPVSLLKRTHPTSDLMNFIFSVDMAIPKSAETLPQKLESLIHDSFPVSKPPASPVAMLTRVPISLPQEPRDRVTDSASPRFTSHSTTSSLSSSADKCSLSVEAPPPIKDASYYKSLVRQHGVERQVVEGQQLNHEQFGSRPKLTTEPGHQSTRGHWKPKASCPKPCKYFSSPKGCCLGLSCPFWHDLSFRQLRTRRVSEAPSGKRVKLN